MPIAQPKNELKNWRNPFESIWNKNPNQRAIHSKYKTQECLEEALEEGKHVMPIPIEVLQKRKKKALGFNQTFLAWFSFCGVCWFIFFNL